VALLALLTEICETVMTAGVVEYGASTSEVAPTIDVMSVDWIVVY
jgi:hypothetical protein